MTDRAPFASVRRLALLGALFCAGCSSFPTKTPEGEAIVMSDADFAVYFERVFRHHNAVVNESMMDLTGERSSPLLHAEVKMDDACQPLNEAAAAAATGEKPGFWTRMRLLDAVPACEAATRRLEKLLSIEPPR